MRISLIASLISRSLNLPLPRKCANVSCNLSERLLNTIFPLRLYRLKQRKIRMDQTSANPQSARQRHNEQ